MSLQPRGPDVQYEVVDALGLPSGARVLDIGCGTGRQALELARRSGFTVVGIDPLPSQVERATQALAAEPALRPRVSFQVGTIESIPLEAGSVELVTCREMLYHVADLATAFGECRRVLSPGGRILVYQLFHTDWLEPREAERFWHGPVHARNADRQHFERCAEGAGFSVEDHIDLRSETIEWAEERDGKASRQLIAAARLLRDRDLYVSRFGRAAYDLRLNDAFWHIFRMIGKLSQHLYVLRAPGG